MRPIYLNLDVSGHFKQSDIITIKSTTPQELYYRLFENKYEIDYTTFEGLRLILEELENGNVYTVSSSEVVELNGIKYVKITIPLAVTNEYSNYRVRPVYVKNGANISLPKFKFFARAEYSPDLEAVIAMTQRVNNIYSVYLNSIKRQEIGAPLGVVPLDENAKIIEQYIPDDILDHVYELYKGHGLKLDSDYFIVYWDYDDQVYYRLNNLNGGTFSINQKPTPFSYDGGTF